VDGGEAAEYKEQMRKELGDLIREGTCQFLQKVKRVKDIELMKQLGE
jgi:hypothetical protein